MELEEWKNRLKMAKRTSNTTANLDVKVKKLGFVYFIYRNFTCKACKKKVESAVRVEFKKKQTLTIFQANLLFSLFVNNKIPYDYANYHNCIAGKGFIENIKEIY